jgi:hypothetical protein
MPNHGNTPRHLTTLLARCLTQPGESISVAELVVACGDRAIGGLLLLLAAPNILPLPPGSASVMSIPIMFMAVQLVFGQQTLWLPQRVLNHRFDRSQSHAVAARLLPWLAKLERLLKPRLSCLLGVVQDRLMGIACLGLAVFMFLPIPLGNLLPAMALTAFALGLMERDGLLVLFGWLLTAACVVVFGTLFGSLWLLFINLPTLTMDS